MFVGNAQQENGVVFFFLVLASDNYSAKTINFEWYTMVYLPEAFQDIRKNPLKKVIL